MWLYFWGHTVYHLIRWFPRNNRTKILFVVMLLTAALVVPQFIVLLLDHSSRWCKYPLLEFLIASLVFTFFLIGFSFLFMVMVPVPNAVKIVFHIFGAICFVISLVHIILVSKANECSSTTEALYYLSLGLAILSGFSIGFFALVLPFWIINRFWKNSVLDLQHRAGMCYEPVTCCSCIWHI